MSKSNSHSAYMDSSKQTGNGYGPLFLFRSRDTCCGGGTGDLIAEVVPGRHLEAIRARHRGFERRSMMRTDFLFTIRECQDLVQAHGDSRGLGFPPVDYRPAANRARALTT